MPAGTLNLICASDVDDYLLIGNPCKTFFSSTYKKYTNFGLFNKYIDANILPKIQASQDSKYEFEIFSGTNQENGDIMLNTMLEIELPNIWSSITYDTNDGYWKSYEFQWIQYLGAIIIQDIHFKINGQTIQKYSGEYLKCKIEKNSNKEELTEFYNMIGHIPELYDPKSIHNHFYPNAHLSDSQTQPQTPYDIEPSIRGRKLIIPVGLWFHNNMKKGFPLFLLNDSQRVKLEITFRPLNQWYRIRDGFMKTIPANTTDKEIINGEYISPNKSSSFHTEFHRFKQPPNHVFMNEDDLFIDKLNEIDIKPRLLYIGVSLSEAEKDVIRKKNDKRILLKEILKEDKESIVNTHTHVIEKKGLITSLLFYFTRTDVSDRNEWTNYTNWKYNNDLPVKLQNTTYLALQNHTNGGNAIPTNIKTTGSYQIKNTKEILKNVTIKMGGVDREPEMPAVVYNKMIPMQYLKKGLHEGVYYYSFELYPNDSEQPSGHFNASNINDFQIILEVIEPLRDPAASQTSTCTANGTIISTTSTQLYDYEFDMHMYIESYQELKIKDGQISVFKTSIGV